jgi:hypothetical protein
MYEDNYLTMEVNSTTGALIYSSGLPPEPSPGTPAGGWLDHSARYANETLYFKTFEPETNWYQCIISVENTSAGASYPYVYRFNMNPSGSKIDLTPISGTPDYNLTGVDYTADGVIGIGDYIVIEGLGAIGTGTSYCISIIFVQNGNTIDFINIYR